MVGAGSCVQETQIHFPKEWIDKKYEINEEEERKDAIQMTKDT